MQRNQTGRELGGKRLTTKVIIIECLINIMDIICELGGLTMKNDKVKFGETHCVVAAQEPNYCGIEDKDFKAEFNSEKWTVEWHWKGKPPVLENKVECY